MVFEPLQLERSWTLETYRKIGGYEAWEKILAREARRASRSSTASRPRACAAAAARASRPGIKWSFMPRNSPVQKYLVCNSDESEPGTCHDRDILRYNPHALIEGLAIGGYATNSTVAYNYIRGEFLGEPVPRFEAALEEAYAAGLLGKNIRGSGVDFDMHTVRRRRRLHLRRRDRAARVARRQAGQAALQAAVPGELRPVRRADHDQQHPELRLGADDPAQGRRSGSRRSGRPNSGGTVIFSVSGHVEKPGNFEVPLGIPFKDLLELAGGVRGGRKLKAVIPGGSSVPVLPGETMLKTNMDYDSLQGGRLGARLRRRHRHGRDHLHGAGARAHLALLHVGVLRPVHAVPRRHRLDEPRC